MISRPGWAEVRRRHFMPYGILERAAYVMAMRILQSDLYPRLEDEEKQAVDTCIENYLGRAHARKRA